MEYLAYGNYDDRDKRISNCFGKDALFFVESMGVEYTKRRRNVQKQEFV